MNKKLEKNLPEQEIPPEQETNNPANLIRLAVAGNADLDKLSKLLDIQERWESTQAKKIYAQAFARAQANITAVVKTRLNVQTRSNYADLGDIIMATKSVYTQEGFSVIFYEGIPMLVDNVRICVNILHEAGHKESYYYDVPLDGTGIKGSTFMTKIHAKASSTSYGCRYLMCMIWNIPTQDNDGNSADNIQMPRTKIVPVTLTPTKPTPENPPKKQLIPVNEKSAFETMLGSFAQAKKVLGEEMYYEFLGGAGFEHANEITRISDGEHILALMRKEAVRLKSGTK